MDALLSIAFRTNYTAILSLICTCKYYSEYPNIWKLACEARFSDKQYFDFWTSKENYLVHERKYFCIVADFLEDDIRNNTVDRYIYEQYGYISGRIEDDTFGIKLTIEAQFILIFQNNWHEISLVGQYKTYEGAKNAICIHELNIQWNYDILHGDEEYVYLIINLEHMVPYFIRSGAFRNISETNPGTYYYGSFSTPITYDPDDDDRPIAF
jgi:hypothetical protein